MLGLKRILQFIRLQLCRKGQQLGSHLTPTKTILVSSNEYLLVIGVSIQNLKKRIQIYLQYIIYCDLYPLAIIRKLKKNTTELWTAFYIANHPDRNDNHIDIYVSYEYLANPQFLYFSDHFLGYVYIIVWHLCHSLKYLHDKMANVSVSSWSETFALVV